MIGVYDDPKNLFVAKFLGTPSINLFDGRIQGGKLWIGEETVMDVDLSDRPVTVGVRPEGFILSDNGSLPCKLIRVEVMGRDVSIVSNHSASQSGQIRSIILSENKVNEDAETVRFDLKPGKVFLFDTETGDRIEVEAHA